MLSPKIVVVLLLCGAALDTASGAIAAKPTISIHAEGGGDTVTDGHPYIVTCHCQEAVRDRNKRYKFTYGGYIYDQQSNESIALIGDIRQIPTFTCQVSRDKGKHYSVSSKSVTPTVRAISPWVEGETTVQEGGSTRLHCESASLEQGLSGATIFFFITNVLVQESDSVYLILENVPLSRNGDYVTCFIRFRGVDSEESNAVTLTVVSDKPYITFNPNPVEDGGYLTVICNTAATGSLTFVFYVNGIAQPQQSSNQITVTADIDYVVTYQCKVSEDGEDFSDLSDPEQPIVTSSTPILEGDVHLVEGENTTLVCQSFFLPTHDAIIKFYLNGHLKQSSTSNQLWVHIVNLKEAIGDRYHCVVVIPEQPPSPSSNVLIIGSCAELPADILFLLDKSGSIGGANFQKVRNFVQTFADSFNISPAGVNIGVICFSTNVANVFSLDAHTDRASLNEAIHAISYTRGSTFTGKALQFVRTDGFTAANGDRPHVTNVLVVLTDGRSNDYDSTTREAALLHQTNLTVVAVGVGSDLNDDELQAIASRAENVFRISSFDYLDTLRDKLQKTACEAKPQTPLLKGETDLFVGDNTTLTCDSNSTLPQSGAEVRFYRDGYLVAVLTQGNQITLQNVPLALSGSVFTCRILVDNIPSDLSNPLVITVTFVPQPEVSFTPDTVEDGEDFEVVCNTDATGNLVYIFFIGGVAQAPQSSNSITETADIENVDFYKCQVSQDGSPFSDPSDPEQPTVVPRKPEVELDPTTVTDGDDFDVICDTDAKGNLIFIFFINGSAQAPQSSNQITVTADIDNVDTYTCQVSVDGGDDFSPQSDPETPQVLPSKPVVEIDPNPVTDGNDFDVICATSAKGNLVFIFFINGRKQPAQTSNQITVTADIDNVDTYKCQVSVDGGDDFSPQSDPETPQVLPSKPVVEFDPNPVTDGNDFDVICATSAKGNLVFIFFINGRKQPAQTSNQITVTADIDNVDTYKCQVSVDGGDDFSPQSDPETPQVLPSKPVVEIDPNPVTDGNDFDVICATSAKGNLVFIFFINGRKQPAQTSNQITVTADIDNVDTYKCQVSVDGGDDFSPQSDPETPQVLPSKPVVEFDPNPVTDGNDFDVICATSAKGNLVFVFFINGRKQPAQTSNQITVTADIDNVDTYKCQVSVDGGDDFSPQSDPETPQVLPSKPVVEFDPNPVTDRNDFDVICVTSAKGNLVFIFFINGRKQPAQTSNQITVTADIDNVDTYECQVSVDGGDDFSPQSDPETPQVKPAQPTLQGDVELTEGDDTTLTCRSESLPLRGAIIRFFRDGQQVQSSKSDELLLRDVSVSEDGDRYTCVVVFRGVPSESSDPLVLEVVPKKPEITFDPNPVEDEELLAIICNTDATGSLTFVFIIDGVEQDAQSSNRITVEADIADDDIFYECKVSVDGGDDFSPVSDPRQPTVTPSTSELDGNFTLTEGEDTVLTCSSNSLPFDGAVVTLTPSTPELDGDFTLTEGEDTVLTCDSNSLPFNGAVVTFFLNGGIVQQGASNTLTISDVTLAQDGDVYVCDITDGNTTSVSSNPITLEVVPSQPEVEFVPTPVTDRDDFDVICNTAATGDLVYIFIIAGVAQDPQTSNQITVTADIENVDTYQCQVSVDGGDVFSEASDPETPEVKPIKPTLQGDVELTEGDDTTLTCRSESLPLRGAIIRFFRDGQQVQSSKSDELVLRDVSVSEDGDRYTCVVVFRGVPSESSDPLVLEVAPNQPEITFSVNPVDDGQVFDVICNTAATGDLEYIFIIDGRAQDPQPSDRITVTADIENVDTYRCRVSRDDGDFSDPSDPKTPTVRPAKPWLEGKTDVSEGEETTLTCRSDSLPLRGATIEFFRNGNLVQSSVYTELQLKEITPKQDGDKYVCTISYNGQTSDPSDVRIINVLPPKPYIYITPNPAEIGKPIKVICKTDITVPYTYLTYVFIVDGDEKAPKRTDTVSDRLKHPIDSYQCKVSVDGGDFSEASDPSSPRGHSWNSGNSGHSGNSGNSGHSGNTGHDDEECITDTPPVYDPHHDVSTSVTPLFSSSTASSTASTTAEPKRRRHRRW